MIQVLTVRLAPVRCDGCHDEPTVAKIVHPGIATIYLGERCAAKLIADLRLEVTHR